MPCLVRAVFLSHRWCRLAVLTWWKKWGSSQGLFYEDTAFWLHPTPAIGGLLQCGPPALLQWAGWLLVPTLAIPVVPLRCISSLVLRCYIIEVKMGKLTQPCV